jgi:hypothetical protein
MVALLLHRSRCDGTTVGFPAAIRISAQRLQRVSRSPAAAAVGASMTGGSGFSTHQPEVAKPEFLAFARSSGWAAAQPHL